MTDAPNPGSPFSPHTINCMRKACGPRPQPCDCGGDEWLRNRLVDRIDGADPGGHESMLVQPLGDGGMIDE